MSLYLWLDEDHRNSLIELALLVPVLLLLLVGGIDIGRGYYLAMEVSTAAEAGAMYGTLNSNDTSGMRSTATLDAKDVPGMTATAATGCECSDGSSAIAGCTTPPSCSLNVVNYVEVDTAYTYVPQFNLPGLPSSYPLTGKSRMRAGR